LIIYRDWGIELKELSQTQTLSVPTHILQFPAPTPGNVSSSLPQQTYGESYPHLLQFMQPHVTASDKHHPKYFKGNITKTKIL
jgi:hypothetical protein